MIPGGRGVPARGCQRAAREPTSDDETDGWAGGASTERTNCRLSHRRCNLARNRKRAAPSPVNRELYRTSRDWGGGHPKGGAEGTVLA